MLTVCDFRSIKVKKLQCRHLPLHIFIFDASNWSLGTRILRKWVFSFFKSASLVIDAVGGGFFVLLEFATNGGSGGSAEIGLVSVETNFGSCLDHLI